MMPCRSVVVTMGLLALWGASGCFSEASDHEGDGGETPTTGTGSTSGVSSSSAATSDPTSGTTVITTSDPSTGSESTSGRADTSSGSTGDTHGPPGGCECPNKAVLCEGFEGDDVPAPWTTPTDAEPDPTIDTGEGFCGMHSLRTAVEAGDNYSVLLHPEVLDEVIPGPTSYSMRVKLTPGCLGALTRVFSIAYLDGVTLRLEIRLMFAGDDTVSVQFVREGMAGPTIPLDFPAITPNEWHEVRFDVDGFAVGGPPLGMGVAIDGDFQPIPGLQLPQIPGPLSVSRTAVGPYRFETPFDDACEILYDDVWIFPPPP